MSRSADDRLGRLDQEALDPSAPSGLERRARAARNLAAVAFRRVRPPDRSRTAPPSGYPKLFIVGCGRSGTSWVQDCVGASGQVVTTQESHAYDNIFTTLRSRGHNVRGWAQVLHRYDIDQRRQRWVGLYWWVTRREYLDIIEDALADRDRSPADAAQDAIEAVFDRWYQRQDVPGATLVEKTPGHLMFGAEILDRFPEARLVEVVRDGRDVCVSLEKQALTLDWPPRARIDQVRLWRRSIEAGDRLHGDPRYADRILRVHYEDLLDDPVPELARVFAHAGLAATTDELAAIVDSQDISRHTGRRDGSHRRKGRAGEWRTELSEADVALFDEIAGEVAARAGYDADGRVRR